MATWYFVVYLLARFEGQFEDLIREDTARKFKDGGLSGLSCLTQPDRPQLKMGSSLSELRALVDTNFEFRALLVAMTTRKGPIVEKPLFFVDFLLDENKDFESIINVIKKHTLELRILGTYNKGKKHEH